MSFSPKQKQILTFPYESDYDALICDGAVRSGKTSIMSLSFVLWMMAEFDRCSFAFCGKSVGAVERNIVQPLLSIRYLQQQFQITYNRSGHVLKVQRGSRMNMVYLFGGKDESSYMLIQGITLAGVLLDEVALMPRSFVEQALARCSVAGAKFWFNCNPENPEHWFRKEWILQAQMFIERLNPTMVLLSAIMKVIINVRSEKCSVCFQMRMFLIPLIAAF